MNTISPALIKKDAITKASLVYKALGLTFKNFKMSLDTLRESIGQNDLTTSLVKTNFANSYNIILSDMITFLVNILQTKINIGTDDSLVIRKVDTSLSEYSNEIWYGHTVQVSETQERRFPPQVVCKYDNFSIVPVITADIVTGYDFLVGTRKYTINDSSTLNLDEQDALIEQTVIERIITVTTIASYLQEYCAINVNIIEKYLTLFNKLFV
jgi:hypothetical protein